MIFISNRSNSPFGGLGCLVLGALFIVGAFYFFKGLFSLIWWAWPVLFVLTLIINWRVVADTGKSFLNLLGRNPLMGLLVAALGVVGFPLLCLYLFLSALGGKKEGRTPFGQAPRWGDFQGGSRRPQVEEEFTEFEELESKPKNSPRTQQDRPPIDPPPAAEKETPKSPPANPYEGLFS